MNVMKPLAGARDRDEQTPMHPWSFTRKHNFPYGLPRPLYVAELEMRDMYFEKYFGMSAKRLEEIYLGRLDKFKSLIKFTRRHGNENARQRLTVLLWAFDTRRLILDSASTRGTPALETALIRRFHPEIERAEFDRDRLRQFRWFLLAEKNVTKRALPGLVHYLMALPPAFDELARWSELSPERQEDLALALFALGSMMGERIVLDVAMRQCSDLQRYYEILDWEEGKGPGESVYQPPTDELSRICLEDRPDALLDFMGKLVGFVNEMYDGDLPRVPHLIAGVRRLHDYINDHFQEILDEYRRSTAKSVENLLLTAEADLAGFSEMDGFSAQGVILKNLREMLALLEIADLETVDALEREFNQFRNAYSKIVEQAWAVYERAGSLEQEIVQLVNAGAIQNAGRIGEITAELQRMRGSFDTLFQVLTSMKLPEVKPAPAVNDDTAPSPSTGPTEEQMLFEDMRAERDTLLLDNRHLKEELSKTAGEAFRAQARQRDANAVASSASEDHARRVATLCIESGRFTPASVLHVIEAVYSNDRVVILPAAHQAVQKSEDFRYSERLYKLLTLLVMDYRDALRRGRPDTEARHILGKAYRASESESVQGNRDLARRRIFQYEGKAIPMFQHLGIGVADSTEKTLRVHFHWDAAKGRIVIGYVGPHLDTISS